MKKFIYIIKGGIEMTAKKEGGAEPRRSIRISNIEWDLIKKTAAKKGLKASKFIMLAVREQLTKGGNHD